MPLVTFRVLFGLLCIYACIWSFLKNDIQTRYLQPQFFFKYYGFEWIPFSGETLLYICYLLWLLSAIGILLGFIFRCSAFLFFLVFTYLQLIDATNFINHYYAIALFSLLLIFIPANRAVSLDTKFNKQLTQLYLPEVYLHILKFQIVVIYFFAGFAKINSDWLLLAQPLQIWLTPYNDIPIVGVMLGNQVMQFVLSWMAMIFDLSIPFLLFYTKTRTFALIAVIVFHSCTGIILNIGLFPLLMISIVPIFLSSDFHQQLWGKFIKNTTLDNKEIKVPKMVLGFFMIYVIVQLILPIRSFFLYTDNVIWTEEGYRFSWRVMLVEKEGLVNIWVTDPRDGRTFEVDQTAYLSPFQIKRMSVRPDHLIQFAHYLRDQYSIKYDIENPVVNAQMYVSINGRPSALLIDKDVDLSKEKFEIRHKDFLKPYPY